MMIADSIIHQQQNLSIRNNGLRSVSSASAPPKLSAEESSMIKKNFATTKPVKLYNMQGAVNEHNFADRGMNVDHRV